MTDENRPEQENEPFSLKGTIATMLVTLTLAGGFYETVEYLSYRPTLFGQRHYEPRFKVGQCIARVNKARTSWEKDSINPYYVAAIENGYYRIYDLYQQVLYKMMDQDINKAGSTEDIKYADEYYNYQSISCDQAFQLMKIYYDKVRRGEL